MGAAWMVVSAELRRHRLQLAGLTVLVALTGGIGVASVLGADRSRTSLDRFIEETNAADVAVFAEDQERLATLADVPEAHVVSQISLLAVTAQAVAGRDDVFLPMVRSHDGRIPYELNGVRVLEGELPAPDEDGKIALHEATAELLRVGVGDPLPMVGYTPADLEEIFAEDGDDGEPSGPMFDLEVAAIIRDPADVLNRPGDIVITPLTTALADRLVDEVGSLGEGAFVELSRGADLEEFTASLRAQGLDVQIERWVGSEPVRDTGFGPTFDLIGDGLVVFGLVVGVAGLLVVGQALARGAVRSRDDVATLDALGLDRRGRLLVSAAPGVLVAAAAGILVGPAALVLSSFFPVGIARRAEPEPGIDAHPGILLGAALVVILVLVTGGLAALVAARQARRTVGRAEPTRRLRAPGVVGRVMSSGDGSNVRSTRAAVLLGAAGVTAALVFAASLDDLLETPEHYGWSFDTAFSEERNDAPAVQGGVDLAADPAVAEVAQTIFQVELEVDGSPMFGYAIGDGSDEIAPVVAAGRVPRAADEVAIGREALRRLGVRIGQDVEVASSSRTARFEVVGQAVVPVSSDGGRIGDGISMTLGAAERLGISGADACSNESTCYTQTAVRWRDGADLDAARDRLVDGDTEFDEPVPPPEVERMDEVESIPWVLAVLLAALATAATLHAIVVTVTRRRRDLVVLRALGATPSDARRGVTAHAMAMVTVSALAGAAGGVAMGRLLWRSVAGSVGLVSAPATPLTLIVALPAAIVCLAGVASLLPARRAGRLRPSTILRAE